MGRQGAYEEVLEATERLIRSGITPRWQCFLNEENREEIVQVLQMYEEIRRTKCPDMEFFVHEGSCDGENRKLYPIRIRKEHIPEELAPYYLDYGKLLTEEDCCRRLKNDLSHPAFPPGGEITLNISNTYDVYYNYTNMTPPWVIGNLKEDEPAELARRIVSGDTPALRRLESVTWAELVQLYGDFSSGRVFALDDYKMFLVNNWLEGC